MGHHYRHIYMAERRQIMKLLERKIPLTQIANIVGRHHSTLYRELRRNFHKNSYAMAAGWFSWNATESARKRRFKRRKLERDRELRYHVIDNFGAKRQLDLFAYTTRVYFSLALDGVTVRLQF